VIGCVRLPYFTVTLYRGQAEIPADRPVIVTYRGKVTACCELAMQHGITPGITVRQAQALLAEAAYLAEQPELTQNALLEVLDTLKVFTPLVEYQKPLKKRLPQTMNPQQAAVFYVNFEALNENDTLLLTEQMLAQVSKVSGTAGSIGLAPTIFVAFVAAHRTGMTFVREGEEIAFLAPQSIALLPLDDEQRYRLTLLGLKTIGQIAALPLSGLVSQFGKHGFTL
jgi:hypothetical protein